jgi:hypothetical protein
MPMMTNEPRRFGQLMLPLTIAAPLMMSACAPQPTYTLYDVQPGGGWPNSGGVFYRPPPPLPPTPPVNPPVVSTPPPNDDSGGVDVAPESAPQPRRHQQPAVIAEPDDPPAAATPLPTFEARQRVPRSVPPAGSSPADPCGWWDLCVLWQ